MSTEQGSRNLKVAVIGAGPAGLSAAYELSKANFQVHIYERSASVGGLAKSIELWNQRVDLGPHRFLTKDIRVKKFWNEVIGDSSIIVPRLTRILYNDKFFAYPLKPQDIIRNFSFSEIFKNIYSYLVRKNDPGFSDQSNMENWLIANFGRELYSVFFKSYTEKLWGLKCSEIDADFAKQRIKKFNLSEAIKNSFGLCKSQSHRTLESSFDYPKTGAGQLYEKAEILIRKNYGEFFFSTSVNKVTYDEKQSSYSIETPFGTESDYKYVLSTMPLTELAKSLGRGDDRLLNQLKKLNYRNTILVYLYLNEETSFKDNWIYVNSPSLKTGRITNYRNWSPYMSADDPGTILSLEYWCQEDDLIWKMNDEELVELAKKEFLSTKLADPQDPIKGKVIRLEKSYPIYQKNYKSILAEIQKHIDSFPGLQALGRYGSFKYNNQDHSILMGILASENIIQNKNHNLWNVNSDFETYQEG